MTTRSAYDAIVIGGGLAGAATAYFLALDGVATLLIERSDLNTQASGTNAGSLHAQIPFEPFALEGEVWAREFAPVVRLLASSVEMWRSLPQLLGADLELEINGGLIAAATEADLRMLEGKVALERAQGLDVELIDGHALRQLAPYLADAIVGGAFCPIEGKANPLLVTPAFAREAARAGARILSRTDVRALGRKNGGYVVETTGGTFHAPRVVNAAGAEAGKIAAMLGVHLEVAGYPIQVSVTEPAEPFVPHLVYYTGEKLSLKQTPRGAFLIGGGWPARLDEQGRPVVDPQSLARNMAVALEVVPSLASVSVVRSWAAIVNGTDSWKPILGELPGAPGFYMNFFPWLGFTGCPLTARITASWAQGREAEVDFDLEAFRVR